jgi:predicted transposase YdaD
VVDLHTLQLCKENYVDAHLRRQIVDVLYTVACKDKGSPGPGFMYVLCEHSSTPQRLMPWRIAKYMVQIVDQYVRETHSEILPVVIPLVVYNGPRPYPYSTDIHPLFGEHQSWAKHYISHRFELLDLNQIPDEALRQHHWSRILVTLFKHAHSRDALNLLASLVPVFHQLHQEP